MARGIDFVFPSVTDNIIITWQLASSPLTEVGREVFPPSVSMQTCIPLNLKRKVYIFRFYSSSDGTTLETQLRPGWSVDGEMFGNTIETYHYVVDGPNSYDPTSEQSILTDARLIGKEYTVSSRGTGFRREDEYQLNDDGFELTVEDEFGGVEQFQTGDTWTVQIIGEKQGSTGDFEPGVVNEVTTSEAFNDNYYAHNVAKGSGAMLTTTFPDFASIQDSKFSFSTYTGTQRYWRLSFEDTVDFMGEERNFIDLAQDEEIEFTASGGVLYVSSYSGNYKKAGETEFTNNKDLRGTILCDGSGTEYNISDFQRMIDNLPEEMKVSYTDWNHSQSVVIGGVTKFYSKNKGKFAIDTINGKFKFPDARAMSFRALLQFDGTTDSERLSQGSGGLQTQQIISHDHGLPDDTHFDGSTFGGQQGSNDSKFDAAKTTGSTGGTEQRVDNLGKYIVAIL
jgi:hypothetical protein